MIDLRSDTVTKPTPAMRQAMADAQVGDDVLGDDPTVKELERQTAALLGKQAALFVPSGTMANQIAVRIHTRPGDEIFVEQTSHIYCFEAGAPAALSGVMCNLLAGQRGVFTADDLQSHFRPVDDHFPRSRLLCIENTHNRGGGRVWPMATIKQVTALAKEHQMRRHLDGARLWNASTATGIAEADYAAEFDTVSVCFSKGLGAPVGSALVGSHELIARARPVRKQFGGGMRQVGIIAAGALYALEHHRARLADDHENARLLANGLSAFDGVAIDLDLVETNIVNFATPGRPAAPLVKALAGQDVHLFAIGPEQFRAVTNLQVSREMIGTALKVIQSAMAS